jgi:hypothetical protein
MLSSTSTRRNGYGAAKCAESPSSQHISYFRWDLGSCGLEDITYIQSWMDRMSVDNLEADSKDVVLAFPQTH